MKLARVIIAGIALSGLMFAGCDRHSFESTSKLHMGHGGGHGDSHSDDEGDGHSSHGSDKSKDSHGTKKGDGHVGKGKKADPSHPAEPAAEKPAGKARDIGL